VHEQDLASQQDKRRRRQQDESVAMSNDHADGVARPAALDVRRGDTSSGEVRREINARGVCHLTLEAIRHRANPVGKPLKDSVVACHLRSDLNALARLKAAIKQIEAMVARPDPSIARN